MNFIESIALRPFSYSEDGITPKFAKDGATFDCPEKLFAGLNAEGFVRRAKIGDGHINLNPAPANTPVLPQPAPSDGSEEIPPPDDPANVVDPGAIDIPSDWGSLRFFALRALAAKFTDAPAAGLTTETATAAIEAEILRRMAANVAAAGAQSDDGQQAAAEQAGSAQPAATPPAQPAA